MAEKPKVAIIVLNWNGKALVLNCLKTLTRINYPNYEIVVVDNGSTDGSQNAIRTSFRTVKMIENNENLGFAKGNNIGIRAALEDTNVRYVCLLNNDTTVDCNFLTELVKVISRDKKIGIVQPKMLKRPGVLDSTGHVFRFGTIIDRGHDEIDKGQYDTKYNIVGACAGACLYRREMLEDIGLFDEQYGIIGYEDAELSWRAYKRGWKAQYVPSAIVYHQRSATTSSSPSLKAKVKLLYVRNQTAMVRQYGTVTMKLMFGLVLIYEGIRNGLETYLRSNIIGGKPYFRELMRLFQIRD